ncbi:hypothetical protein CAPTEDRAFT_91831 [Capitella teleta]|uniref:Ionotropic glutamate receptor C-terminal domain-containing protein n=1 Tax=Capitella teleta TaxID=283909 RepID=R7U5C2_CAPTE|nr:hypothetical protein CAPTEDRAFT_91831 [Capitella teleta]|eukprot:ELT98320.1 hypothetical protein CAPTEDRAFT_91831 [Capitella teleta]
MPSTQTSLFGNFLRPLEIYVWFYIIIALFIVTVVFWWIWFWTRELVFITKGDTFWYALGTVLQQGSPRSPRSCSGRMLVAFWWFFAITVAAVYSGNLTASLAVTKLNIPYKTFADLAQQNVFKLGILGGTSDVEFFKVLSINTHLIKAVAPLFLF